MTETRAKKLAILTSVMETLCMADQAIAKLKDDYEVNRIDDVEAHGRETISLR